MLMKKIFYIILGTVFTSFFMMNTIFAKDLQLDKNEITDWNIKITCDTKDLKNSQEINFKFEKNENVVSNKFAPGMLATADIVIDSSEVNYPIDIIANINDTCLYNNFKLTLYLNNKLYKPGDIAQIDVNNVNSFNSENGKNILKLVLEWINNDEIDTYIGTNINTIKLPITIEVKQHI